MRTWPALVLAAAACGGGAPGGPGRGGTHGHGGERVAAVCPAGSTLCAVLVTNDCRDDGATVRCRYGPVEGLDEIELVPLDMGVEDEAASIRIRAEDGVFEASPGPGTYRVRPSGQRFRGFTVTLEHAPVVLDTRSAPEAGARIVGHVRIAVGGGAEGNTTVSDGGPGRFLVLSVLRFAGDEVLDRSAPRFAIADREGRFALAVPPGRYYVSDVWEVEDSGRATFGPNMTMVTGQAVDLAAGGTAELELMAAEAAP